MLKTLRHFWFYVRLAAGEHAYEHYLTHMASHHPGAQPLSRRAFYQQRTQRKWEGINRCC